MDGLLWGMIALGVALLVLGLYLVNARRKEQASLPLDESMRASADNDPLATPSEVDRPSSEPLQRSTGRVTRPSPRLEPSLDGTSSASQADSPVEFDEFGVGPVRLRPQDEAVAARLAAGRTQRKPRFSYLSERTEQSAPHATANPVPSTPETRAETETTPAAASQPDTSRPQRATDVIPLYLIARQPEGFAGAVLRDLFARMGFEFGEMDVYHLSSAEGQVLFSLMNGVAPGTFDPAHLHELSTPALALFLRLPIETQPVLVLEQFIDLAYRMADELDATVLDASREPLSTEAVDRMRATVLNED